MLDVTIEVRSEVDNESKMEFKSNIDSEILIGYPLNISSSISSIYPVTPSETASTAETPIIPMEEAITVIVVLLALVKRFLPLKPKVVPMDILAFSSSLDLDKADLVDLASRNSAISSSAEYGIESPTTSPSSKLMIRVEYLLAISGL